MSVKCPRVPKVSVVPRVTIILIDFIVSRVMIAPRVTFILVVSILSRVSRKGTFTKHLEVYLNFYCSDLVEKKTCNSIGQWSSYPTYWTF